MNEIFKDIPSYEGIYQVSNLGRVKSLGRNVYGKLNSVRTLPERILKNNINKMGYYIVSLCFNGKCHTKKVHQLVAMAFLGHKPCGMKMVVDHIDGNKLNNRVDNLQIISARDNISKSDIKRTSKYTGVSWHKATRKWISQIQLSGKMCYLGIYDCEHKAHLAYMNKLSEIK